MTTFWQPQHSRETKKERKKERDQKTLTTNWIPRPWSSRPEVVTSEDKARRPQVLALEDQGHDHDHDHDHDLVLAATTFAENRNWEGERKREQDQKMLTKIGPQGRYPAGLS